MTLPWIPSLGASYDVGVGGLSLALILLSIAAFGVALEFLGFALAVVALVLVGGLADPDLRPLESLGLALFLAIFSVGIFVGLLGMPLAVWPNF